MLTLLQKEKHFPLLYALAADTVCQNVKSRDWINFCSWPVLRFSIEKFSTGESLCFFQESNMTRSGFMWIIGITACPSLDESPTVYFVKCGIFFIIFFMKHTLFCQTFFCLSLIMSREIGKPCKRIKLKVKLLNTLTQKNTFFKLLCNFGK